MIFQKILEDIIQGVEGGLAGLVIGRDGIALETYLRNDSDGGMDIQARRLANGAFERGVTEMRVDLRRLDRRDAGALLRSEARHADHRRGTA